jgi:hypothetical protein
MCAAAIVLRLLLPAARDFIAFCFLHIQCTTLPSFLAQYLSLAELEVLITFAIECLC